MASDAQAGRAPGQCGRFGEGCSVGHQRGRGHNATRVRLDDGTVHARSESEVIRIDDEAAQGESLAGEFVGTTRGGKIRACEVLRRGDYERAAAIVCPSREARFCFDPIFAAHVYSQKRFACMSLSLTPAFPTMMRIHGGG